MIAALLSDEGVPAPHREERVELADGRTIGIAEYGDAHGRAVLWFPGTPGGRRQIPPRAVAVARARGIRLIGIERPGIGDSTPHLYPSVLGWADDVAEVTTRLGVGRFALVGLSGGGPYVLACAHRLAHRVVAGAVLGGVAPALGEDAAAGGAMSLATRLAAVVHTLREPLAVAVWATAFALRPLASGAFDLAVSAMPPGDREVMRRPEMKAMFLDDMLLAGRRQLHAPVYDIVLFTRPWGFSPRDVRVPIRFWHGDADPIVPLEHAHHLAALVPDAELRVRPGEGHMGNLDAAEEILDTLLAFWPAEADRPPPR
ncbi:MAG: alpha/beta hydrolase [Deltaproteobacteria bacterium]|nr:alpha/beta hydrolase [Deltaproteobacteria bacterium]